MSRGYAFRDCWNKQVDLNTVDEEMCRVLSEPVDDKRFNYDWESVISFGFSIMWHGGVGAPHSTMTEEDWKDYAEKNLYAEKRYFPSYVFIHFAKRFLCGQYHFECWG